MEEYVRALIGALTQHVRFRGVLITAHGDLDVPGAVLPPVLVPALGRKAVELAGRLA